MKFIEISKSRPSHNFWRLSVTCLVNHLKCNFNSKLLDSKLRSGEIVLFVCNLQKSWVYFHVKKKLSWEIFAQNAIWNFQILKEHYAISPKPINLKRNLNVIHVDRNDIILVIFTIVNFR